MSFTTWTIEQILSLAQDQSLLGAAESVADPAKWLRLGSYNGGIWGEFNNGDKPAHQTLLALPNLSMSCDCPSHKYPCRHTLALALLHTRSPKIFHSAGPPGWVQTFYKLSAAELPRQQPDFKLQLAKTQAGLEAYALWLQDMVHSGLAELPKKPAKYWVSMANRLSDNGLYKLATEVRQLSSLAKAPNAPKAKALMQGNQLKRPSPRPGKQTTPETIGPHLSCSASAAIT